jgi:uncharacterized protein
MNTEELFNLTELAVADSFSSDSTGHDLFHLKRVFSIAMDLQEVEGGNRLVLGIAALVHDVHRLMETEAHKLVHPRDSLDRVTKILSTVPLDEDILNQVLHLVEFHDDYALDGQSVEPQLLELSLLQDADRLDALGAIGIARCFMYYGSHSAPMWDPLVPLQKSYDATKRDPSAIHHFYNKLFKLEKTFFTVHATKLARERTTLMKNFVDTFLKEWG